MYSVRGVGEGVGTRGRRGRDRVPVSDPPRTPSRPPSFSRDLSVDTKPNPFSNPSSKNFWEKIMVYRSV